MPNRGSRALAFLFGAGASARLDYPMVTQFFGQFKNMQGFPNDDCDRLWTCIRVLEGRSSDERYPEIDAELLFGLAEQLLYVEQALKKGQDPFTGSQGTKPPRLRSGITAADFYRRLTDGIVNVYGRNPKELAAHSDPLHELVERADDLHPPGEPLWLFTTNYDTVIEDSLGRWGRYPEGAFSHLRLETGFAPVQPHPFTPDRFEVMAGEGERIVNLVKLHGSATWKHESAEPASRVIDSGLRAPTGQDCVLYFGYKRFPDAEPFVTLHRLFKRALLRPLTLVAIGSQFADPYLRELVDFALDANSELKVICCLGTEPKEGSHVHKLIERHGKRFELLRDTEGTPVAFGDRFSDILQVKLQAFDRTSG